MSDAEPEPGPWRLTALAADAPRVAPWRILLDADSPEDAEAELDPALGRVAPFDVVTCVPRRASLARLARHWFVRDDGRAVRLPRIADRMERAFRPRAGYDRPGVAWGSYGSDWREAWLLGKNRRAAGCTERLALAVASGLPGPVLAATLAASYSRLGAPFASQADRTLAEGLQAVNALGAGTPGAAADLLAWVAARGAAPGGRPEPIRSGAIAFFETSLLELADVFRGDTERVVGAAVDAMDAWARATQGASGKSTAPWAEADLLRDLDARLPLSVVLLAATGDP